MKLMFRDSLRFQTRVSLGLDLGIGLNRLRRYWVFKGFRLIGLF